LPWGENLLAEKTLLHTPYQNFPEAFHQKLLNYLEDYMAVGGMPEAVQHWVEQKDIFICVNVQYAIINTYISCNFNIIC
jgi:predicted AAA+ superfamily ATPase